MAAFYGDEDDIWKCPQHPSRRRRHTGICPICLRERLSALCPDCANVRPCGCCTTSASSSSSSSSFSLLSFNADNFPTIGSVGRVSNLIENEPSFRRSRSVAFPFFRSARYNSGNEADRKVLASENTAAGKSKSSFWMVFWPHRSKRGKAEKELREDESEVDFKIMRRSRSVAVASTHHGKASGGGLEGRSSGKSKGIGWYFPSPMKVFRQSKESKIVQERSPLHRG